MAPHTTEADILESYLLHSMLFHNFFSFSQFQQLFPAPNRSHPHIKTLYRDLEFTRSVNADVVRENIDFQTHNANTLRRALLRGLQAKHYSGADQQQKRKHEGDEEEPGLDTEIAIDAHILGPHSMLPKHDRYHDAKSLLKELSYQWESVDMEIAVKQDDDDYALAKMQEIVGILSDLRYGKFAKVAGSEAGDGLEKRVVHSLKALEQACTQSSE